MAQADSRHNRSRAASKGAMVTGAGKKPSAGKSTTRRPTFEVAHEAFLSAQDAWEALEKVPIRRQAVVDRLVDKRRNVLARAAKVLAAIPAQDVAQLSAKTAALWRRVKFEDPVHCSDYVEEEHIAMMKNIDADAKRLAAQQSRGR